MALSLPVVPSELRQTRSPLHFVMFYHSVVSDWNNGNAHFLRGLARELTAQGHHVTIYEPRNAWSIVNLQQDYPGDPQQDFEVAFPDIKYVRYNPQHLHLDEVLQTADVAIVHEWNDHALVSDVGRHRAQNRHYTLLFHDTHHRSVTDPAAMAAYELSDYDGVLAFGNVIRDIYLEKGWAERAWTLHEAADTQLFYPREPIEPQDDILWVGNWGDEERTAELREYFIEPARDMQLKCCVYGVRYPQQAIQALNSAGIQYCGLLPNYRLPETARRFRAMIHIPRRPYVEALPGIPTIRPFEALACGIPLVSSFWHDSENLFTAGEDYLLARTQAEMHEHLHAALNDDALAKQLAAQGLKTIREKHTCSHRARQLLQIIEISDTPAAKKLGSLCIPNPL